MNVVGTSGATTAADALAANALAADAPAANAAAAGAKVAGAKAGSPLTRATRGWLDHLRVERGAADNTLTSYNRDLARYVEFLAGRGITDPAVVSESDVTGFLAQLREGTAERPPLSASSAARTLIAVRGLHRFLALEGVTETDPAVGVAPPKVPKRLPKAISVAQVEDLLSAASLGDSPAALRDRAMLEVLYGAGARISEVTGLDLDDIDFGGPDDGDHGSEEIDRRPGSVRLVGKGNKERVVPLGSYAREAVTAYTVRARPSMATRGKGTPALFLNLRGGRISRQGAWAAIHAAAERAGLGDTVSPHTLRHSFATHMLEGGADIRVVQELLGHASVTTTQIYTMVTVQHLREVYAEAHPRAR
jgi:integrase/recombinase XerD